MSNREAEYRLKLAEGFLEEARQDLQLGRWRSCVDNSQLAAENAAKSLLARIGPVGRTHEPGEILLEALREGRFAPAIESQVRRIAERASRLGPNIHVESDYGDEANWRTPWEIFDGTKAKQALELADEAVRLSQQIIKEREQK